MSLRPYQIKAIDAVTNALKRGIDKQMIVMATGTGKTKTAVDLTQQLGFNRGLWITDREELVSQSALAFIKAKFDESFYNHVQNVGFVNYLRDKHYFAGKEFKMGLIKADVFEPSGNVVMASAATLHRRLDLFDSSEFDYVICDEAHLFMSPTLSKSVNYFTPKLLLGLTATPYRMDGLPLGNLFDEIVYEYGMKDGIADGYLCEMDAIRIKTNVNLDSVHTLGGEFNQKELSNEVNTLSRNLLCADSYLKYCNGRQGIFFGVDIQHCIDLEEAFKSKGINAKAVSSNEELTGDRSETVKMYKEGKYDVLINVNILTTGFDHPNTGCIGMARPTKSKTMYVQGVGRGSRLKDEAFVAKFGQNCIILDFVDNTNKHSLINAHELDKELPLEDRTFISQEKKELILAERMRKSAKITHEQKEDERIKLFDIPKIKINKSIRMREAATEAQLAVIKKWGYDTENAVYTKGMISKIFGDQEISEKQKAFFKHKGYDVEGKKISVVQAKIMSEEIREREANKSYKKS